jgi:hypothetical protein
MAQGWRVMGGDMNTLYAPWRQARAGAARRFYTGDLVGDGSGGGRIESHAEATPLTGRHGAPSAEQKAELSIAGDADSALGALFNRLIRDGQIRLTVRS